MSYPKLYNRLSFFEPVLAVSGSATKPLAAINLGAANATHGEFVCVRPCILREARVAVTLENVAATTTAPYVVLSKYTTPLAGGTSTAIGTVTVPNGTNIGAVVKKASLSTQFAEGDVVQIKHVVGTGGTAAGHANVTWFCEDSPEVTGNNTDVSTSST